MRYALAALLLAGCLSTRPETREALPSEYALVGALKAAWGAHGRDVPRCALLDRVDVVPLSQPDVADECAATGTRVSACVYAVNRTAFSPLSTLIYVDRDADDYAHTRLMLHEYGHALRGCWWEEGGRSVERLRAGAPEGVTISHPRDPKHDDAELWGPILDHATDLSGARP